MAALPPAPGDDVPNKKLPASVTFTTDPDVDRIGDALPPVARFIHERTGTCVDIYHGSDPDGIYWSVQAQLGGYNDDAVVQPDEPGEMVSASVAVIGPQFDSYQTAWWVAFGWLHGWINRNSSIGRVRDLYRDD